VIVAFIDMHREAYGVEPICRVVPIAPSTYYAYAARRANPERSPARAKRDAGLRERIEQVWHKNCRVYGVRKVWRQLKRDGVAVARCTVARLMRQLGLAGAVRGRKVKTTMPDQEAMRPLDLVHRECTVATPNRLWVSDRRTWRPGEGSSMWRS
jgi:transposase InsO family protein